jgi:hypothetical protein
MIPPFTMRNSGEVWGSLFIGSIFLIIASVICWTIRYELRVRRWIREQPTRSAQAKGMIISFDEKTESGRMTVHYRFTDAYGKTREGSQIFARLLFPDALKNTEQVTVIYHPGDPSLNYIEGYAQQYRQAETHYIHGFVMMALFAAGFFLVFWR